METIEHSKVKKKGQHQQQDAPLLSSDFQISAAADQGGRKYMEDRLQIEIGRNPAGGLEFIFAAIYDGHGGVQASEYASTHLFQNIVNNQAFYSNDDNEVMDAIRAGFLRTQNDMLKAAEQWPPTLTGFPCTAGTTVTCAIIRDGKLFTGHVGDSSIILANFAEEAAGYHDAKLTEDHKPENKTERIRIEKAGGAIATKSGIYRVIWKRPIRGHRGPVRRSTSTENVPFLAVARALGDFWSYNPDTGQYVVSPEPDVDVFRLKNSDNFIVVASDGLTNVLSTQAIIGLLRDEKRASTLPLADGANKNDSQNDGGLQLNFAHSLMQNALQKWGTLRADNISIICIKLGANDEIGGQQHSFVAEEIPPGIDIGKQLIEHPFATVHVNKMRTFRLINTHQLVATNANDDKSTATTGKQESPVKTSAIINGGEQSPVKEIINGECHHHHQPNKEGGGGSEGDSDREEEAEKEEETAKEEEEEVVVVTNAAKVNPNPNNNDNIFKVPFMRAGVKRRIQDVEDGGYEYVRHIPSTSSNALRFGATSSNALQFGTTSSNSLQFSTTSSKTSSSVSASKNVLYHQKKEEEQQEEEEDEESMEAEAIQMKPPPAKRSKLQSVFNFFTNLFKW